MMGMTFGCEDAIEKKRQSFVNASQNGFKVQWGIWKAVAQGTTCILPFNGQWSS